MDASTALRSFRDITGTISRVKSLPMHTNLYTLGKLQVSGFAVHGNCFFPLRTKSPSPISCAKTGEATAKAKSSDGTTQGSKEKITSPIPTFPSSFEALLLEVCDETEIAELKLKIGGLEMHVKRNVGASKALISVPSPTTPPPVPTEPMEKSGAAVPAPSSPKSSPEKTTPFTNVSFGKSPRLEALEASGSSAYVLVSSPTVGSFRRGRTLKGKKQPPSCKEGDFIKEGQVIGWLDQFGTELPVKSDVSGEVIKLLVADGEAVGYGDPLIAVLPSFHGININ